jgi:hypothetical protein
MKANDIAYGFQNDAGDKNDARDKNEGLPIKNENNGNWDDLPKLYAGSDIRIYSDGDYYHSMERFCNTKKNLYLHCIGRKPRFVEENLLSSCSSKPEQPSQTSLGSSEQSNFNNFSNHFKNINCTGLVYSWIKNCRNYWS